MSGQHTHDLRMVTVQGHKVPLMIDRAPDGLEWFTAYDDDNDRWRFRQRPETMGGHWLTIDRGSHVAERKSLTEAVAVALDAGATFERYQ